MLIFTNRATVMPEFNLSGFGEVREGKPALLRIGCRAWRGLPASSPLCKKSTRGLDYFSDVFSRIRGDCPISRVGNGLPTQWVPMVLMYWVMALPYRVGIGSAWMAGIVLDVLEGQYSV